MEVTRRRGRRRKKLLDNLQDRRGYSHLKEEEKGEMEVTRRRGRRRKKLMDDLQDRGRYSQSKEEALDCSMWRNRFGRGVGPLVRQTTE
jgi:hypothetical protein